MCKKEGFRKKNIDFSRKLNNNENEFIEEEKKERKVGFCSSYLRVTSDLVAGLLVGGCVGMYLDGLFDFFPFLTLLIGLMGFFGGMLNLYRSFSKENEGVCKG